MEPLPVVGDSQGGLEALAAAMATPGSAQAQRERSSAAAPASPAAPPLKPAERAFAAACAQLGVEPHPALHDALATLEPEAYAPHTPFVRPGRGAAGQGPERHRQVHPGGQASQPAAPTQHMRHPSPPAGGAVLKLPAEAALQHLEALLVLVAMRPAAALVDDSQSGDGAAPPPSAYLRTLHLDLSGHAVSAGQLRDLLLDAPHRLKQCHMLQGLVLQGCQLGPHALAHLRSWKAVKVLQGLKRLVLADNPHLGMPADQAHWLQARLSQAPLRLLDLRRTGGRWAGMGLSVGPLALW